MYVPWVFFNYDFIAINIMFSNFWKNFLWFSRGATYRAHIVIETFKWEPRKLRF